MNVKRNLLVLISVVFLTTQFTSCKSKNASSVDDLAEVLVQFNEQYESTNLEETYVAYELKKKKVVSRPMHIYLFTYNSKKIKQAELIELLKTSELVKEAQPNRNVQIRN